MREDPLRAMGDWTDGYREAVNVAPMMAVMKIVILRKVTYFCQAAPTAMLRDQSWTAHGKYPPRYQGQIITWY